MSYIIDQLDNFLSARNHTYNFIPPPTYPHHPQILTEKIYSKVELAKALGKLAPALVDYAQNHSEIVIKLFLNNVFGNISIILEIKWSLNTHRILLDIRLLNPDAKPLCVPGMHRRLLLCKILVGRHNSLALKHFKMVVNMLNGEVRLTSALQAPVCTTYGAMGAFVLSYMKLFSGNQEMLYELVGQARDVCGEAGSQHLGEARRDVIKQLYYYSQFTSVAINLTLQSTNDQQSIMRKQRKEIDSIQRLKTNYAPIRNRNGLQLFTFCDNGQVSSEVANFDISQLDRQQITEKTAPPTAQRTRNSNDYVLNYIRVNNQDERLLKKIHQSNFTLLYLKYVDYCHVGSYNANMTPADLARLPPHKKLMVIKREKNSKRSRIAHEKMILTKIKDSMSLFLPKYYISIDKTNDSDLELMAEYIQYPNLSEFVKQNRDTVSYQTKIYFGYIIAQGLRYLQEYQIAHLDLKPANIMLYKKLMVKFIDFGESYHPDVKNHQPGFTVPYSAPENYSSPQHYTHKNDIFSLGVILYQLFLGKYPFFFYDQRRRQEVYRKGSVASYWYLTPEDNLSFGEGTIFPILQLLIGKCLSLNPQERPELQWVVLILRKCLDYLY